jgi:hypothetical protein
MTNTDYFSGRWFGSDGAAHYAANWWNQNFSTATLRATQRIVGSGYVVAIEQRYPCGWLISAYMPAERELWGQMILPLVAS